MNSDPCRFYGSAAPVEENLLHDDKTVSVSRVSGEWKSNHVSSTHFGFVSSGTVRLNCASGTFDLATGMYFCVPGDLQLVARGHCLVIGHESYRGLFAVGGPVESRGRLQYIDGCSDTLLIAPPVLGEPCLNLLYIPPGTAQSEHTHPSLRAGVIVKGRGRCVTPAKEYNLTPGALFVIEPDAFHSFHTDESSDLSVIAYHPDSDFGPTNDDHPMLNRTWIAGRAPINDPARPGNRGAPR